MLRETSHDILKRERPIVDAPLDRRKLAFYRRPFLLLLSALMFAYTAAAWCWFGYRLMAGDWVSGILLGGGVALLVSAGEVIFSDDSLMAYLLFLSPDAIVSYLFGYAGVEAVVWLIAGELGRIYRFTVDSAWVMGLATLLCGVWSIASARLPERVIFGPRLRRRIRKVLGLERDNYD